MANVVCPDCIGALAVASQIKKVKDLPGSLFPVADLAVLVSSIPDVIERFLKNMVQLINVYVIQSAGNLFQTIKSLVNFSPDKLSVMGKEC